MEQQDQNIAQMRENPFMQYNHIKIRQVTQDSARVSLDIVRESTNIYGVVHGGAYFTMADCCAGLAARSDGRQYVTQDAAVQFVRNTGEGRVTAQAQVLHRGRRVCLVEVKITDEAGALLFNGTFSMYCIHP